jgi:hypothetical protein
MALNALIDLLLQALVGHEAMIGPRADNEPGRHRHVQLLGDIAQAGHFDSRRFGMGLVDIFQDQHQVLFHGMRRFPEEG